MIDERSLTGGIMESNDMKRYTLENIKLIGMMGVNEDKKISTLLNHLFMSAGKKVAFIDLADSSNHSLRMEELLYSHMNISDGELEYAVAHLPYQALCHNDLLNISLDSVIHTFIGESSKNERHRVNEVFKNLSSKGLAIINVDDEAHLDFVRYLEDKLIITYGLSPRATITASSIEAASNLHFTCCIQRGITTRSGLEIDPMEFPVFIPNFGKEDVHYALAAIGVGLICGVSLEKIMEAFQVHEQTTKKIKYESR
ncbi:UDP-N-acetylmuramoyl-L-alanyl-D-glutamate--2,6-diaminopimelate ligase [Anaerosolibacter carboniphilus]|uniref:UDP-N-acetylmuramoyl-L-alanyl-D-glutamate--2, 6-diaminopimelate ligase n=1 Tax=Anaerosolibacter carboniphilus TaxID=1417629 RepID=A0A841L425_9FIRM|nr:hypothetical protein [Anaerosolibacter carboniphilus]MBB6217075.1 UDP-N-acetylmuramoyl-L-alanyl-D-glutamate--2,6-diaminopimelate ligase [Anaerosolibacter carboniphilus]